jgi:hypothetical protein
MSSGLGGMTWPPPPVVRGNIVRRIALIVSAAAAALTAGALLASPAMAGTSAAPASVNTTVSTTTTLTLSPPTVTFGAESVEQLRVTVTSPGGTPPGQVTVHLGSATFCAIILLNGTGTCSLAASQLPIGNYAFTATYTGDTAVSPSGNTTFLSSASVPPQPLTVTPSVGLELSLSSSQLLYGDEQAETFTATVTSPSGTPTGQVTLADGSTAFCTITLVNGTGSCSLSPQQVFPGTYRPIATYSGDSTFPSATVASGGPLVITGAGQTTTSLVLSPATITFGSEQAENITVFVGGIDGPPTGQVSIQSGGGHRAIPICTVNLNNGTANCTLTASQLAVGSYQLTATYSGDDLFAASTSAPATLTVTS